MKTVYAGMFVLGIDGAGCFIGWSLGQIGSAMSLAARTNYSPVVQRTFTLPSSVLGRTCVTILILSICLVFQVLGTPVGLLDLFTLDTSAESSISEGFSIPTVPSELERPINPRFSIEAPPPLYQMFLSDLIFRPPQYIAILLTHKRPKSV